MSTVIKPLSAETLPDFLRFFDSIGFTDNLDWSGCYCTFFHHAGNVDDWMRRTKNDNRREAVDLIRAGRMKGFLAYEGDEPCGFCNINRKTALSFDKNRAQVKSDKDHETLSIVCFLVAPRKRKQAIGKSLLSSVIDRHEFDAIGFLESYPSKAATKDSENYHGPVSLYQSRGFAVVSEYDSYYVMRRDANCGVHFVGKGI
jgi:ribosomal protein S18 acetylase RimI-like enzyme